MTTPKLNRLAWWTVAILLALLPFHAFLWTWFHSFYWTESWTIFVQAWKEILVGALALLALIKLITTRKFPKNRSFWIGVALVFLAILYLAFGSNPLGQKILGLRSATIFIVAFLAIQFFSFSEKQKQRLVSVILGAAGLVILFALLQKFFLPADFLKNFGYSENVSSWLPGGNLPMYHLVGDTNTVRLQSTFAGPNQLAAYLLVVLPLSAFLWYSPKVLNKILLTFLLLGGTATLYFTYSRSAWLGFAVILSVFLISTWRQYYQGKLKIPLLTAFAILVCASGVGFFYRTQLNEIVLRSASTSEHLSRSVEAAKFVVQNPLGLGLGQSAGVSQRFDTENNTGLTPENTYLGTALELGWLGGMLFLAFIFALLIEQKRQSSPLFYSLLGIAVIAVFLHPLEDMPTALTLFLLAGSEPS